MVGILALSMMLAAHPGHRRTPVVEVVESAGPAVVNIAASARRTPFSDSGHNDAWSRFFGRRPRPRSEPQSLGSGVVVAAADFLPTAKGVLVLTNEHVVAGASDITVILRDRRKIRAEVLGGDPEFDVAVLLLSEGESLPSVQLGTSSDLMIGEPVVAIGNPFGLASTVTTGVVSALHRAIQAGERVYEDFIQTDAAINPGNSGGALFNIEGKLIGINTAIHGEGTGIGFAIPVDKVRAIVQEVLQYGEVRPAYTGIIVAGQRGGDGALVEAIVPGSPAAKAGLKDGDVIVDLGGQEVTDGGDFRRLERALVPGRARALIVRRGEARVPLELVVGELLAPEAAKVALARLGLELDVGRSGVRIRRVESRSSAARIGIQVGDLLLGIAGRRVRSQAELDALLAAVHDADRISAVIGRGGRAYSVTLGLGRL